MCKDTSSCITYQSHTKFHGTPNIISPPGPAHPTPTATITIAAATVAIAAHTGARHCALLDHLGR